MAVDDPQGCVWWGWRGGQGGVIFQGDACSLKSVSRGAVGEMALRSPPAPLRSVLPCSPHFTGSPCSQNKRVMKHMMQQASWCRLSGIQFPSRHLNSNTVCLSDAPQITAETKMVRPHSIVNTGCLRKCVRGKTCVKWGRGKVLKWGEVWTLPCDDREWLSYLYQWLAALWSLGLMS